MISAQKAKSIADQIFPQRKNHIIPDEQKTRYKEMLNKVSEIIEEKACVGNLDIAIILDFNFELAYYLLRELEDFDYQVSLTTQTSYSGSGKYMLLVKWG